ncbi:hypothetical protein [Parasphingorhabdus sp.]
MSKRLMFSAIVATIMMIATTAYSHSQNQTNETASAYEIVNS